jgi:hypothetical protein
MKTAIPDRYLRIEEFDRHADGIDFPVEVWATAAQLTDVRTSEELQKITGLDSLMIEDALARLISRGLVKKHLVSWQDFANSGQGPLADTTLDSTHTQEIAETTPELANCKVSLRLGQVVMPQVSKNLLNARIGKLLTSIHQPALAAPPTDHHLLKDVVDQITRHASDAIAGQLLVYQVFLRIPLKLLKAEGINSLRFLDQKTVIKSQELYELICDAAHEVLGITLPPFKNNRAQHWGDEAA